MKVIGATVNCERGGEQFATYARKCSHWISNTFLVCIVVLLLLSSSGSVQHTRDCPVSLKMNHTNECICVMLDIKCTGLDEMPEFYRESDIWSGIYMPHQGVPSVPRHAFYHLKVKKIVLNYNPLGSAIHANAFTGVENTLEELHLGGCRIKSLPSVMLLGMSQLKVLHLFDNELTEIHAYLFREATKLTELLLWGNKLKSLDDNIFNGVTNLLRLDLDHNEIEKLGTNVFRNMPHLETLHLGGNQIKSIYANTFPSLLNLKVLNLDSNGLQFVWPGTFDNLRHLVTLDLHNNKINFLRDNLFKNLKRLTILWLQDNELQHCWSKTFEGLHRLQKLYLSENKLAKLSEGVFKRSPKLKHVYLDNNNLTEVSKCIFSRRSRINTLSLIGNPVRCTCGMAWIVDLTLRGAHVWGTCGLTTFSQSFSALSHRHTYIDANCQFVSSECKIN